MTSDNRALKGGRRFALSSPEATCMAVGIAGGAGLVGVAAVLPAATGDGFVAFLAGGWGAWGIITWQLWRHRRVRANAVAATLAANSALAGARADFVPALGFATSVTLLRAWLVAIVAGHLLLPPAIGMAGMVVGVIYSVAAVLDGVDGRIARGRAYVTALGSRMDVATDALGLLVAPIVAMRADRLPPWYLLLALAYPVMRAALALRVRLGMPVFRERLRPNPRARLFAGAQMGVVATALFPVLPRALLWTAATLAMIPTLALFLREWRSATEARDQDEVAPAPSPVPSAGN